MISKSEPTRSGTPQVQSIIITAIILFALSGLMVGITVGAFTRPPKASPNNPNQINNVGTTPTPAPTTPSPTAAPDVRLGPPELTLSSPNGPQTYTAKIQAQDPQKKPVTTDGITCRIWLVPRGEDQQTDPGTHFLNSATDQLKHPDNPNQTFPNEISNALVFNPPTVTQVQPCSKGSATWQFTLSPSVDKGDYYLVALTDWQGNRYNWTWANITIDGKKQGT